MTDQTGAHDPQADDPAASSAEESSAAGAGGAPQPDERPSGPAVPEPGLAVPSSARSLEVLRTVAAVLVVLLVLGGALFALRGRLFDQGSVSSSPSDEKAAPQSRETFPEGDTGVFAALPAEFVFSAGGVWETVVTIDGDGGFVGDNEYTVEGSVGPGYPDGTMYECRFTGRFVDVQQVDDGEYSMRVDRLTVTSGGGESIVDGVLVVPCDPGSDPYGFDHADEFRLYLPGKSTATLPQGFVDWMTAIPGWSGDLAGLPFYGLYNVEGEEGFVGEDAASAQDPPACSQDALRTAKDDAGGSSSQPLEPQDSTQYYDSELVVHACSAGWALVEEDQQSGHFLTFWLMRHGDSGWHIVAQTAVRVDAPLSDGLFSSVVLAGSGYSADEIAAALGSTTVDGRPIFF